MIGSKSIPLAHSLSLNSNQSERKHGYRITVQTGECNWMGKDVQVYVQLVGDLGKTVLTRILDREFTSNSTTEFVVFAASVGNVRKLYLKHTGNDGGCLMEVMRAFVQNEDLQRAWEFITPTVLAWETKNETILYPHTLVSAGKRSIRQSLDRLFNESQPDDEVKEDRLVKRIIFKLDFYCKQAQTFYVSGSTDALGSWQNDRAIRMTRMTGQDGGLNDRLWYLELETDELNDLGYKFVLLSDEDRSVIYESELQRKVVIAGEGPKDTIEGGIPDDSPKMTTLKQGIILDEDDGLSLTDGIQENAPPSSYDDYVSSAEKAKTDEEFSSPVGSSEFPSEHQVSGELVMTEDNIHMHEKLSEMEQQLEQMHQKWWSEMEERRRLFNQLQEIRGNVRVFCRCRPPRNASEAISVDFPDRDNKGPKTEFNRPRLLSVEGGKMYEFDRVFSPEDNQQDVYDDLSALVTSVLDGFTVCIFAYGQTGSGKTYTMNGEDHDRGVNYRALHDLFRMSEESAEQFETRIDISMLEIYNENLRDLLATEAVKLDIKKGPEGTHVPNLKWYDVRSAQEVFDVMNIGSQNRSSGATNMNAQSSRSHLVVSINVTRQDRVSGERLSSNLHLIDLAGSERLSRTNATGERLREAQHINKSLSALGDVFNSIIAKNTHVPFRNSKLTYLLQDALGGDAKALMFVNISPAEKDCSETVSSLNFASRVSKAELGSARQNVEISESRKVATQVSALEKENRALVSKNAELEAELQNVNETMEQRIRQTEQRANGIQKDLEQEVIYMQKQLREVEKGATEGYAYAEDNEKLQRQLKEAYIKIDSLERDAMNMSTHSAPKTPYGGGGTGTESPGKYQMPTRSILAELNRAAAEEQTPPQRYKSRPESLQSRFSGARTGTAVKTSIPKPRTAVKATRTSRIEEENRHNQPTARPGAPGTGFRRGTQTARASGLDRLTRPTISSTRSSVQSNGEDESDVDSVNGSRRLRAGDAVSTVRKPQRGSGTYNTRPQRVFQA